MYPIPSHVFEELTPEDVIRSKLPLGTLRPHVGALPKGYVFCHGQTISKGTHDFSKPDKIRIPDLRDFPIRFPSSTEEPNPELEEVYPSPPGSDTGFHWIMKVRHVE